MLLICYLMFLLTQSIFFVTKNVFKKIEIAFNTFKNSEIVNFVLLKYLLTINYQILKTF